MTTSLLNLDRPQERFAAATQETQAQEKAQGYERPYPAPKPPAPPVVPPAPRNVLGEDTGFEFELVFGRQQIASTGLILMVTLAVFCGVSYAIGRAAGSTPAVNDPAQAPVATQIAPAASIKPVAPDASVAAKPVPAAIGDGSPLFAEAVPGQIYMQIGAVDKGLGGIWAEGLRTHGLHAFVSSGPTDKSWRVLVGPLPDPQSYQRAKDLMDGLGITTFGKRYENAPAQAKPAADPAAQAASLTQPAAAAEQP